MEIDPDKPSERAMEIVRELMTNGAGQQADRLVLVKDNDRNGHSRTPYSDLGGYSPRAAAIIVDRCLQAARAEVGREIRAAVETQFNRCGERAST